MEFNIFATRHIAFYGTTQNQISVNRLSKNHYFSYRGGGLITVY